MAYEVEKLNMVSSGKNTEGSTVWSYTKTDEIWSTIIGSGYFNVASIKFAINDLIYITASDQNNFVRITAVSPNVTVAVLPVTPPLEIGSLGDRFELSAGVIGAVSAYLDFQSGVFAYPYYSNLSASVNSTNTHIRSFSDVITVLNGASVTNAYSSHSQISLNNGGSITDELVGYYSAINSSESDAADQPDEFMCNFYAIHDNDGAVPNISLPDGYNCCYVGVGKGFSAPPDAIYVAVIGGVGSDISAAFKVVSDNFGKEFEYGLDLTNADSDGDTISIADIRMNSGVTISSGSGAPTASLPKGSLYLRTDGSATNNRLYIATDAVGGWTHLVTGA